MDVEILWPSGSGGSCENGRIRDGTELPWVDSPTGPLNGGYHGNNGGFADAA